MQTRILILATLLGFSILQAMAQTDPNTGARSGHEPGVGVSFPLSSHASNTGSGDVRSTIAPTLPELAVGENATAQQFLRAARAALATGRTGEAQEAMERAQTRLLDRATPLFQTDRPSTHPGVAEISVALRALGAGDRSRALRGIDAAIPLAN